MKGNYVKIERDKLLAIARDLNVLVVSLDRLGAAHSDEEGRELADSLLEFTKDWRVFEKLSKARQVVDEALFAEVTSSEEERDLEAQLDAPRYWSDPRNPGAS